MEALQRHMFTWLFHTSGFSARSYGLKKIHTIFVKVKPDWLFLAIHGKIYSLTCLAGQLNKTSLRATACKKLELYLRFPLVSQQRRRRSRLGHARECEAANPRACNQIVLPARATFKFLMLCCFSVNADVMQ